MIKNLVKMMIVIYEKVKKVKHFSYLGVIILSYFAFILFM